MSVKLLQRSDIYVVSCYSSLRHQSLFMIFVIVTCDMADSFAVCTSPIFKQALLSLCVTKYFQQNDSL